MSSESIAALRKNAGRELAQLAEEHMKHDLQQSDRDALESASRKVRNYTLIGSALGLGLGIAMAFRVRSLRTQMFNAFRTMEKPTHVKFADGRLEPIPDLTSYAQPSALGDAVAYFFFSAGGLFVGGELGLLAGSAAGKRTISSDPESMKRIKQAFKNFRKDSLKKEIEWLDDGEKREGSTDLGIPGF
ncbi:hypothetical protein BDY21DRAFT_337885 [Lineolata rhizophorae]|uniref:Uncharacterized protein n=1 Tax=Lineolata rhizophorae TaxID=578093 RepID=A0A6A6P680_9PEZI|nr:hypothetical protein BDY21DRAFT_337885 [Lineolata rhizophorae]